MSTTDRQAAPTRALESFAEVQARLALCMRKGENGAEVVVSEAVRGCIRVHRGGAELAVLAVGASLPSTNFDAALIVGADGALAEALADLGEERVQLLSLPASAAVVDHSLRAALTMASQRHRAEMVDRLLDVGAALGAQSDPSAILAMILREARRMAGADAGSIYLVEGPRELPLGDRKLRFRFAENASISSSDLAEFSVPINESSVVGACVLSERSITLTDLYSADPSERSFGGRTFSHDRSFDERLGYQTRSMLTVPMRAPGGEVLGVIQLINARTNPRDPSPLVDAADFDRKVVAFDADAERLCRAFAAQGAVALDNANLYAEIEALFEGFVRASVKAIEQRDPTTSGHSERVAALTVGLAKVVDRADSGPLAGLRYGRDALREIEYAALLHDFGKVGVREDVLVKASKLHPIQHTRIMARFDHMRTALRLDLLERRLVANDPGAIADLEIEAVRIRAEIDALLELVRTANRPSLLTEDCSAGIRALEGRSFDTGTGERLHLLENEDLDSLLIARGSLTDAERLEIQSHVVHTYTFLAQIPWGRSLSQVPDIAGKHHEYLDGSGYPKGVSAERIPVQARMMTIADIFDALTASDRPYKKAVPLERALAILEAEVRAGKLDSDLFSAFIDAEVYRVIDSD